MALYVNGEEVPQEMIQAESDRLRPDYDRMVRARNPEGGDGELEQWSRENVIERILLRQEAQRRASKEPIADASEEKAGDGAVLERRHVHELLQSLTADVEAPGEPEMRAHYKEHREHFKAPEQVHAAHIVKHVRAPQEREAAYVAILNAKTQIDQGKSFEELAAGMSDCPEKAGDLGRFGRGQMVQEFEDVVFELEAGGVSDVFESPFGYHIAKVYERQKGGVLPFEQVKDAIRQRLLNEKRGAVIEAFVDQLKEQATIQER